MQTNVPFDLRPFLWPNGLPKIPPMRLAQKTKILSIPVYLNLENKLPGPHSTHERLLDIKCFFSRRPCAGPRSSCTSWPSPGCPPRSPPPSPSPPPCWATRSAPSPRSSSSSSWTGSGTSFATRPAANDYKVVIMPRSFS